MTEKICKDICKLREINAVENTEKANGISLPTSMVAFFKQNNGGAPINNIFEIDGSEYELRYFLSFNEDDFHSIFKPLESFLDDTNREIVPFAKDSFDNYYCINISNNKIYFWDKDTDMYNEISKDFDEFIEHMR